jgi:hypothetical protein
MLVFVLVLGGVAWALLALRSGRDLRVASIWLTVLGPAAAGVVLEDPGKPVIVAATLFPLAGFVIAFARRRDELDRLFAGLRAHPLAPFAILYAACGSYGFAWGLWRGNDPVLAAGQTFTAALFVFGFAVAGPVLASRASRERWLIFTLLVAALSLPGLLPYTAWVAAPGEPVMVRFLEPTAFYAPLCALLALALVLPRHKLLGTTLTGFFALLTLLTFTRSYWLGLAVGVIVLLAFNLSVPTARGRRVLPRLRRPRPSELALPAVVASVGTAVLLFTPVAPLALERGAQVREGSGDASVEVRGHELRAVVRHIQHTPVGGLGSGGQFVSLHHLDSSRVFFGPTNFLHNAYLYFPLKFGALGFAALFALLGGVVAMLGRAARRVRLEGASAASFPAVAAAILALSATAPNLVDPSYSLFGGAVLFLAGIRPATHATPLALNAASAPRPRSASSASVSKRRTKSRTQTARRRRRFLPKPYLIYVNALEQLLQDVGSVLDVGCGSRSPLADVRGRFRSVGVDAHRPSLELSRAAGIHDDYIESGVTDIDVAPLSM